MGILHWTADHTHEPGGLEVATNEGMFAPEEAPVTPTAQPRADTTITLRVNGEHHRIAIDNRATLLDVLREDLGLTGSKKGCDHGQCGACTVLVDDRRANSCLLLAVAQDGLDVLTVEGLTELSHFGEPSAGGPTDGAAEPLHPLQQAFVDQDAFQCGYCTPGQLCSALGMLAEAAAGHPSHVTAQGPPIGGPVELTEPEIRERMSGNLCRCGAYPNIVAAVREANQ